jgi:hypothetical protein
VRSEFFVVKILGTGVALEIDDGSAAKVIDRSMGGLSAYAVDMGSCARYNDDING